jgi:hypothetical protein
LKIYIYAQGSGGYRFQGSRTVTVNGVRIGVGQVRYFQEGNNLIAPF